MKNFQKKVGIFVLTTFMTTTVLSDNLYARQTEYISFEQEIKLFESSLRLFKQGAFGEFSQNYQDVLGLKDRNYVENLLSRLEWLPNVRSGLDSFEVVYENWEPIKVRIVDEEKFILLIDNKYFQWKENESFSENIESIYSDYILKLPDYAWSPYSNLFINWFVTTAIASESGHSVDDAEEPLNVEVSEGVNESPPNKKKLSKGQKWMIGIAAALVIGLVAYLYLKKKKDKKKKKNNSEIDDQAFFQELEWNRQDPAAPNAQVTKTLHDVNIESRGKMTMNADSIGDWARGPLGGDLHGVINIATQQNGKWVGGKFDHVRADTKVRDFKNLCGYNSVCPSSGEKVRMWLTSYDGRQATNVVERTWP